MTEPAAPYDVYVLKFGKVKSGHTLNQTDFGFVDDIGFREFDKVRKLAVLLAANDAEHRLYMRTKSEFEEEINRLS